MARAPFFPKRHAAYSWVCTPEGQRKKKWIYGKTREDVHQKWISQQKAAQDRPSVTRVQTLATHLQYWLSEIVKPNLAPLTYQTYETFVRLHITPYLGSNRLDLDGCAVASRDVRPDQITAARRRSARSIHSRLRAWVAASTTGGATPARCA
jgi:hypothetical protein